MSEANVCTERQPDVNVQQARSDAKHINATLMLFVIEYTILSKRVELRNNVINIY